MNTAERISRIFEEKFGQSCTAVARAPGRVNLLGEHVDYNDGYVMPVATDLATYVAFSPTSTDDSHLWAEDYGQESNFSSSSLVEKKDLAGETLSDWARYPAGVAWSLMQAGIRIHGLNAAFASDLPRGAGLSSSASVEMAFAVAWTHLAGASPPPMELARLCQRAENEYVGVNCGIMDQAASACSQAGRVMLLDCRTLEFETLPLPDGMLVIVADTGVRHKLAGSAYNDRRRACEQAVRMLQADLPAIRALRDVTPEEFDRLAWKLPAEVEMPARHVVEEIERTRQAASLLRSADVRAFGRLMNTCHASLRDLYEVSCPELDSMASIAQSLPGCFGARLTGAGFGGCTVNLVDQEKVEPFVNSLRAGYQRATGRHAAIYVCAASGGAGTLNT